MDPGHRDDQDAIFTFPKFGKVRDTYFKDREAPNDKNHEAGCIREKPGV
jgi:hypothetical protein